MALHKNYCLWQLRRLEALSYTSHAFFMYKAKFVSHRQVL